jgi:hypothetical protein
MAVLTIDTGVEGDWDARVRIEPASPVRLAQQVVEAVDATRRRYLPTPRAGERFAMLAIKTA